MPTLKKIPTLIGIPLFILIGVIGIGTVNQLQRFVQTNQSSIQPQNVAFANVTDTSFTVTWHTEAESPGWIDVVRSGTKESTAYFDDRNPDRKPGAYRMHIVTARGLTPATTYEVTVISSGKKFLEKDKPLQIATGPTLDEPLTQVDPLYGTVLNRNHLPANDSILFLTSDGSQTLATYVKNSGSWIIPVASMRTSALTAYSETGDTVYKLTVKSGSEQSQIQFTSSHGRPMPLIVLGESQDYMSDGMVRGTTSTTVPAAVIPSITPKSGINHDVAIIFPPQNGIINTGYPQIRGTGIPGIPLTVTLGLTKPVSETVTVANDGTWKYSPQHALAPGQQSVTITTRSVGGSPMALTHVFTVLKSGTQVLGEATPSSSITPTQTLTPTFTPTPVASSTAIPTQTPAVPATPTAIPFVQAQPPPPVTGSPLPAMFAITVGILLLSAGILIVP